MSIREVDYEAQQASYMTASWLRTAIEEIDSNFGKNYAVKNPSLVGDFIQTASRKYHASLLNENNALEQVVISLDSTVENVNRSETRTLIANSVRLSSLTCRQALFAFKTCWIKIHPQHTGAEYDAAVVEFEKILGL